MTLRRNTGKNGGRCREARRHFVGKLIVLKKSLQRFQVVLVFRAYRSGA